MANEESVCPVPNCKICLKAAEYAKEQEEKGKFHYVLSENGPSLPLQRTQCCLAKKLRPYPCLSSIDRCDPALLAFVMVMRVDDVRITPGPEPEIVAFVEYDGIESFDERAMKLMKENKDLKERVAQLESALERYYSQIIRGYDATGKSSNAVINCLPIDVIGAYESVRKFT